MGGVLGRCTHLAGGRGGGGGIGVVGKLRRVGILRPAVVKLT